MAESNSIEVEEVDKTLMDFEGSDENPKETLEQLTADLNRLDEQERDAKKSNNYDKNRAIFLIQSALLGISYSIVWPTLWVYVKEDFKLSLTAAKFVYGLAFVAYPIASILSAYLVERTTMSTKAVIMILNGAEIVGSLIFSLNFHPSLLVIGRFVAGLGDAFYVILMRDMKAKHGYTKNQAMTMECLAAFILGVILSPAVNIITTYMSFDAMSWHVNAHNFPGLSTSVLFIIMEFIVLIFLPAKLETEVSVKEAKRDECFVMTDFHAWGYKAIFVGCYSLLYTYIVAFFEMSIPIILYDRLKVDSVGVMLLYAVIGTLYSMILMFGMTINLRNQLEFSVGLSVLAKTAGLFGILYLGFSSEEVHEIVCVGLLVFSLGTLWSTDDILFINLVRVIIPPPQREYTHNLRKSISKFGFGIAAVTVPFCLSGSIYIVVGPLLVFLVYICFCFFVVIRYLEHNAHNEIK